MGALGFIGEWSLYPLRSSENDPKASLNQHQSLSGEVLPHFDIDNHSVAEKLKNLEIDPIHLEL